jgi:hypothetical protein
MLLTPEEIARLKAARDEQEWHNACDDIKRARRGQYPDDWVSSGMRSLAILRNCGIWTSVE